MNLIEVIETLQAQAKEIVAEYEEKSKELTNYYQRRLDEINIALKVNMELNTVCLNCKGSGIIEETFEDEVYQTKCPDCDGTGKIDK